jgi:hypothetical protein
MSDNPEQPFTPLSVEELRKIAENFGFGKPKDEPKPKGMSEKLFRRKKLWHRDRTW